MNKKVIFLSGILIATFIYGVAVGAKKIFPYNQIKTLKNSIMGTVKQDNFSPYYYHKSSQFKVIMNNVKPKYVMIGDSITDGGLWNELLIRNDIVNRGISGDTTDGVLKRLDSLQDSIKKAFVMIGINDLGRGKSVDYIFNNYVKIIEILKNKNIIPVIQSTLYAEKYRSNNVRLLNQKLIKYSNENNITYVNLNKILSSNELLDKRFTLDNLHLNGNAYILWSKEISKYLD